MKHTRLFLSLLWICTACAVGGSCHGQTADARVVPSAEAAEVGRPAPDFTVTGLDGQPLTLSKELRKKQYIILMFSRASW